MYNIISHDSHLFIELEAINEYTVGVISIWIVITTGFGSFKKFSKNILVKLNPRGVGVVLH